MSPAEESEIPKIDTPDTTMDLNQAPDVEFADQKSNKKEEVEVKLEDTEKQIDVDQIRKAAEIAQELQDGADKFNRDLTPEETTYLTQKISGFLNAIYRSGIFQVMEKIWDKTPNLLKEIGLGEGVIGYTLNFTSITKPLVDFNRGMVEAGMLLPPEGINPEDFAKDSALMLKAMKYILPIVVLAQPEVAILLPFIPLMEKLLSAKTELLANVRVDINASRAELQLVQGETRRRIATPPASIPLDKAA